MAETPSARVTRMQESMRRAFAAIESLTEKEKKLDDALARLAAARIATGRSFTETEGLRQQKDRGFPRIDASIENPMQAQMDAERSRQLDARIAELLADIRKLRRNRQ
jgi:signal recognition particle GTPase